MLLSVGLVWAVLIQTLHRINGEDCAAKFLNGHEGFVLDIETSVDRGAVFIDSPPITKAEDCVKACCLLPQCNVVLVDERDSDFTCSLFNCLYKQEFACRFVKKIGFSSFVLDSVYQHYLDAPGTKKGEPGRKTVAPVAVAGRNVVVRKGEAVTLRGVESRAPTDATITSYKWNLQKGDPSVVMEGNADQLLVSNLNSGTYVFQLHVTDSKGHSDTDTVNIQVLTQEQSDMYCLVAKEVGLCRASFNRWHYDAASLRCEKFIYGGCKGNYNNFLSEKECSDACSNVKGTPPPTNENCTAPCVEGQFRCLSGCCLDQSLECDGKPQCGDSSDETSCSQINQTFSSLLKVSFDNNLANCTEPPKAGPCRENRSAWYYNPIQQHCHPFTFSGCQGNGNNFGSKDACEKNCNGVTKKAIFAPGRFEELEETESGSIAIAIVLAVSILVLLAVLAFFFLKGQKKRAHQPVATSPPLPGDGGEDDTVVYRSTTKPV
ncbi:unnamed protein product [Lota lota]